MASTNKTSLGLNQWEASDKPVRQDFVNDNVILDRILAKLGGDLTSKRIYPTLLLPSQVEDLWINASQVGKIVSVSMGFKIVNTISNGSYIDLVKYLPAPLHQLRMTETTDNGQGNVCRLQLEKDGRLQIIDCITGAGFYKFTTTYIAA